MLSQKGVAAAFAVTVLLLIAAYINAAGTASHTISARPQQYLHDQYVSEDGWSRRHDWSITHVVVPFSASQLPRVLLALKFWNDRFPPCTPYTEAKREGPLPTLVLFLAVAPPLSEGLKQMEELRAEYNKQTRVLRCFREMVTIPIVIPQDNDRMLGSRIMFEKLWPHSTRYRRGWGIQYPGPEPPTFESFLNLGTNLTEAQVFQPILQDPEYIILMEPDMVPARSSWLHHMQSVVKYPQEPFWIKGSNFHGDFERIPKAPGIQWHINGNAIYNWGDRAFFEWYTVTLQAYMKKHGRTTGGTGWDVDSMDFLHDTSEYTSGTQDWQSMFVFTSAIRNEYPEDGRSVEEAVKKYPSAIMFHPKKRWF